MLRQALLTLVLLGATALPSLAADTTQLDQGLKALAQGQYKEAVSKLEQYTRLQPEDRAALQALAQGYLELKQFELADATLNTAQGLDRSDPRTHFLRGRLRLAQQDYLRARSEFRTVLYFKAQTGELWYYLAQTYQALGDSAAAADALSQGLSAADTPPDTQARLLLLQASQEPKNSQDLIEKALAIKGLSPAMQADLTARQADLMIAGGDLQTLILRQLKLLEKSLGSEEQAQRVMAQTESWLGKSKHAKQDWEFYLKQLEGLNEKKPTPLLRRQLIRLYHRQGLYENLQTLYQLDLLENGSKMSEKELAAAYHRLADVFLKEGFLDFAFNNYEHASNLDAHDTEALKRMGVLYMVAEKPNDSIKLFEKARQELPQDRENLLFMSMAQALLYHDDEARQLLGMVPADFRPELRARIETILLAEERKVDMRFWQLLIPDNKIFGTN